MGPRAYLDIEEVIRVARDQGAELVHPGYGFLAESAEFARRCAEAGVTFLGPSPDALEVAGDKTATMDLARELGIPVARSTPNLAEASEALDLLRSSPSGIVFKAAGGGGGRGIARVHEESELDAAFQRCSSEALRGFGDPRVFAETWIADARHIEVQALGTPDGVLILGDRDCSLQRRRQKVVEIAPAPGLSDEVRASLHSAAQQLLGAIHYMSLATVEFLVSADHWVLLEVNPRIQVEHTITEETTGIDLVACQLSLAMGECLETQGLLPSGGVVEVGCAIQARVGAEYFDSEGILHPSVGTIDSIDLPAGPRVRVDTWVRSGSTVGGLYDPLLAKIIVRDTSLEAAAARLSQALTEVDCVGVRTNAAYVHAVLQNADLGVSTTSWIDENTDLLYAETERLRGASPSAESSETAAVQPAELSSTVELEPHETPVLAALSGTIVSLTPQNGELGMIEAMKMHHPITASGYESARPLVAIGQTVTAGQAVFAIVAAGNLAQSQVEVQMDPHPAVQEVIDRHAFALDEARPDAVKKIHDRGRRTARENLDDLLVPGTFVEYGPTVIAAQTARRSVEDLVERTTGDGLIGGTGIIRTPDGDREAVVMSYDYMVMAGTQGVRNHAKTDRLLQLAETRQLPVILFAEGGGGRPGDTDRAPGAQLNVMTFATMASLRGKVPLIAIASGRTFAGNAALASVCDVIIATREVNLGMGGPAMIEGGGLGQWAPEDIGPASVHTRNGVIDLLVDDDAAAVRTTKDVLGTLTARRSTATHDTASEAVHEPDPLLSRSAVPGDRLRAFDMRRVIEGVVDTDSFLELRPDYAPGAITGFARVRGQSVAIIANNNHHLGGAIDVDAARSFSQHIELASSHGVPVVAFVDTPGFMVGPEAEVEPGVRAFGNLFLAGARCTAPYGAVIVRKGYGLGAMAMTAGSFLSPQFTVAWPSGEMGPMGLEGGVRLGYAKELAALEDREQQQELYDSLLAAAYAEGRAMTAAMQFDVDDVIDPATTRHWIASL